MKNASDVKPKNTTAQDLDKSAMADTKKNMPENVLVHKVRFVTIDASHAGQRIDNFLLRELKDTPRSYVYRILRKGEVRVNKKRAKPTQKLQDQDVVRIPPVYLPVKEKQETIPQSFLDALSQAIILEDDDIILINKSSGLAVHGGSGVRFGLIESFRQLRPELPFVELVHRLDKETSGIVMLAKSRGVLLELHEMLKQKQINKFYQTLILGQWHGGKQHIKNHLQKNRGSKQKVRVVKGESLDKSDKAKESESIFRPLTVFQSYSLMEVELLTGRMHQIRTQLADLGNPVMGDSQYGDFAANRSAKKEIGLKRLFLHAYHLNFKLKSSGKIYDCKIDLPGELTAVIEKLKTN
ncbi:RluA family pseudouridine synthase [Cocleimonas flava]|uniref:Pseudouridine synthase n=1 Tax=Cocleimonas flava TaxID=634765 RepID=A0A4R1F8G0_9GAMM|nr:RluA family pseudouridine synthase [Cocleimonas flava]TCJ87021.1 ribosomal large subunit pseudouridine synthase C [Cocleimonas flava]